MTQYKAIFMPRTKFAQYRFGSLMPNAVAAVNTAIAFEIRVQSFMGDFFNNVIWHSFVIHFEASVIIREIEHTVFT